MQRQRIADRPGRRALEGGALRRDAFAGIGAGRAASKPAADSAVLSFAVTTTSSHTIRQVRLVFDGREVATVDRPGGSGQVEIKATVTAARGPHLIQLVVADQASSPNPYRAMGSITTPTRIYDLVPVEGLVKTGEALEIRVVL